MHNRKKSDAALTDEQNEIIERKKAGYNSLSAQFMERKGRGDLSSESLALTEQLIRVNPDFYSVWNFRREILLSLHAEVGLTEIVPSEKLQSEAAAVLRDAELSLSNGGIKKNPKSYGAWHHRQWILNRIHMDVESELELCQQYLKADQRNFHCWNYRRYLVATGGVSNENELEFSTLKIEENFSNYSAFHHRSVYIRALDIPVVELIDQEMVIVESAIFTDPFDQSAFWYYQFLLRWGFESTTGNESNLRWYMDFLNRQMELLNSLIEVESHSKWALVALVETMQRSLSVVGDAMESVSHRAKIRETLIFLCEIDAKHANRYRFLNYNM